MASSYKSCSSSKTKTTSNEANMTTSTSTTIANSGLLKQTNVGTPFANGGSSFQPSEAKVEPLNIQFELAINFHNEKDLTIIDKTLANRGAKVTSVDVAEKTVQVEFKLADRFQLAGDESITTNNDVQSLQRYIEQQTGFVTVVRGIGSKASAVAELRPQSSTFNDDDDLHQGVFGVVRMSQLTNDHCFIDGLIEGLRTDEQYLLAIREFGDLSGDAFENTGAPYVKIAEQLSSSHNLSIHKILPNCNVVSIIGRSIAISLLNSTGQIISAGVVARASTVQANRKQVCSCSGKTLWQERRDRQKEESS